MTIAAGNIVRNAVVLTIVVAVHLALIFAFSRNRFPQVRDTDEFRGTWIVFDGSRPAPSKPTMRFKKQGLGIPRRSETDDHAIQVTGPNAPAHRELPRIDWRAEGAQAASDVVTRRVNEDARHAFSSKRKSIELVPKPAGPDPVFTRPIHERGDTERFDDGELATWIDNQCYATNKDFGEQRTNANTVVMVCKGNVGKPPVRRDMFDHLKPR